jgi:folate-binding protein YgfZ
MSPTSAPLHDAVPAEGVDTGVAWHYGDPLREQRLLDTGAGVVDRSNRDVLTVIGPDRLPWLHSICSQHVEGLRDGDSTESLVLSPHGHVEQHWHVTELGETVWIDTEPGAAAEVLSYLDKMRFLRRVESSDVSPHWAVLTVAGPAAETVLAVAGVPQPPAGRADALEGSGFVRRLPQRSEFDLVVPVERKDEMFAQLVAAGAAPTGMWAYEAIRVAARRPRLGFETDHRTIPHEVGWIGTAVHLQKGCYRGQETVARVHNLGKTPRRLVLVHLSGESDDLPEPGTPVTLDGRAVGFLGTAIQHYELGPIALAVVKRSLPDDAQVTAGAVALRIDPEPATA